MKMSRAAINNYGQLDEQELPQPLNACPRQQSSQSDGQDVIGISVQQQLAPPYAIEYRPSIFLPLTIAAVGSQSSAFVVVFFYHVGIFVVVFSKFGKSRGCR